MDAKALRRRMILAPTPTTREKVSVVPVWLLVQVLDRSASTAETPGAGPTRSSASGRQPSATLGLRPNISSSPAVQTTFRARFLEAGPSYLKAAVLGSEQAVILRWPTVTGLESGEFVLERLASSEP